MLSGRIESHEFPSVGKRLGHQNRLTSSIRPFTTSEGPDNSETNSKEGIFDDCGLLTDVFPVGVFVCTC